MKAIQENPYVSARREWNERYGDHIQAARNWRSVALASLGIAMIACIGVSWIGAQNKLVPYVVEVDKLGESVAVRRADAAGLVDERVTKAQLARFISCWRSVTADLALQKKLVFELYAMLSNGDAAATVISNEMRAHSPFERAKTETVSVEINNLLLPAGETWQVDWTETRRDRRGALLETTHWRAALTVAYHPPSTEADLLRNPIGLYVKEASWSPLMASK